MVQSGQLFEDERVRQLLQAELREQFNYEDEAGVEFLLFLLNQKRRPKVFEKVIRVLLSFRQGYSFDEHFQASLETLELLGKVFPSAYVDDAVPAVARELSTPAGNKLREELCGMENPTPRTILAAIFTAYDIEPGDVGNAALELLDSSYGLQEGFVRVLARLVEKDGPAQAATFALLKLSQEVTRELNESAPITQNEGRSETEQAGTEWLAELQEARDKSGLILKEIAQKAGTNFSTVQKLFQRGQLPKDRNVLAKIIDLILQDEAQAFLERHDLHRVA